MVDSQVPLGPDPGTVGRRYATAKRASATRDGVTDVFHHDLVIPTDRRIVTYKGTVSTFRTPGIAGTAGQKLFAIHNATGSAILIDVLSLNVTIMETVVKAITVLPPLIRAWRFTAIPTNGTAVTKRGPDSAQSSSGSATVWQGASADGTASGTALTITLPAATYVSQAPIQRQITAAGIEPYREVPMLQYTGVQKLRALEGIAIFLDYTAAGQSLTTDMYTVDCVWEEYTEF